MPGIARYSALAAALLPAFFVGPAPAGADYRDAVGYTELVQVLGSATPTGAGVGVTQVESLNEAGHYFPYDTDPQFVGTTLTDVTGTSTGFSGHATQVGHCLYGNDSSMAPEVEQADVYWARDWLQGGFLRTGSPFAGEPLTEPRDIQNHTWVAFSYAQATNAIRRLDYAVRRDGFTAVAGLNNGAVVPLPLLLAHSYNAISVGLSNGEHSRGTTTFDEAGRVKPDIVAPLSATSWATPVVGAAAALLIETARAAPAWNEAERPEVVKALLMAGATRDEFASWDRLPHRPLDDVYGAGELNILNSYLILAGGPQPQGTGALVVPTGWAAGTREAGTTGRYFFEVPPGYVATELSAMLVWNRHIVDGNVSPARWEPVPELPDMTLVLRSADGYVPGAVVDLSTSAVDNVEHVLQHDLPPGRYVFEVETDRSTEFGLAWRMTLEIAVPTLAGISVDGGGARITVDGVPFTEYALEYAQDPAAKWTPIATNTPTDSPFELLDPSAGLQTRRAYRLLMLGVE